MAVGNGSGRGSDASRDEQDSDLDAAAVAELRALDPDGSQGLLPQLAHAYHQSAPGLVAEMTRALETDDPSALGQAAHTLKSSSAVLGASKIAQLCREIEALGNGGFTEGADAFLEGVRGEMATVLEQLAIWS